MVRDVSTNLRWTGIATLGSGVVTFILGTLAAMTAAGPVVSVLAGFLLALFISICVATFALSWTMIEVVEKEMREHV